MYMCVKCETPLAPEEPTRARINGAYAGVSARCIR
jgi:RNase P subunit RPR2